MPAVRALKPSLFRFFVELRAHNDREWFHDNKERYESDVKEPLIGFINAFGPRLEKISANFVADPRPQGGSMFRIHRDVRFSKDKSPYKTHAALQFRHVRGKDVHAPGYYLHLEPDNVFMGVGLWRPDRDALAAIREAIVEDPKRWTSAIRGQGFKERFQLSGESLKRPPKGIDPDHPLIEDLRRKDFIAVHNFKARAALKPEFLTDFTRACRTASPFMRFLTESIGLDF